MRALVYTGPNSLEIREEDFPTPRTDEVVVKVEAVGICGSDMHAYHGHDSRRPAPLVLGHEAAGRIVSGSRTGERVTVNPLVVDPNCPYAIDGRWHLSPTRQILSMPPRPGAFAEYVRVPERNVERIPDALTIEHAALAEPIAVSWHAVRLGMERLHIPMAAASTVVLGGGAIGLAAALVARHFGAVDLRVGETNALRRDALQPTENIETYTPGSASEPAESSVDLVIDAVGAMGSRVSASRMARPGGVIVHLGLLPGIDGLDIRKVTLQEITFTGSYCYTPVDFKQTVAAIAGGHLGNLQWYEERPLSEGARAFASIDAGSVSSAKVLLRP
jgi:2-desacetyl-2-hydroxyethyl bacteriochlorophyllide A dehydrogenase